MFFRLGEWVNEQSKAIWLVSLDKCNLKGYISLSD